MSMDISRLSGGKMRNEAALQRRVPRRYWTARRHFELVLVGAKKYLTAGTAMPTSAGSSNDERSPSPPPIGQMTLSPSARSPSPTSPSVRDTRGGAGAPKFKKQYLTAVLSEDRLFLLSGVASAAAVIRLRDIQQPETRTEAPRFADAGKLRNCQHVVLHWNEPADHRASPAAGCFHSRPNTNTCTAGQETCYDFYTFEDGSVLVPHLRQAWLHQVMRHTLGQSVRIAADSPRTAVALMDEITDDLVESDDLEERAAMLEDLTEPLSYDRAMIEHFFEGRTHGLAAFVIRELQVAAEWPGDDPASYSLARLIYVTALLRVLGAVFQNSETVRERHRWLSMPRMRHDELLRLVIQYGNHHRLWHDIDGDGSGSDGEDAELGTGSLEVTAEDRARFEAAKSAAGATSSKTVDRGAPAYVSTFDEEQVEAYNALFDEQVAVVSALADAVSFEATAYGLPAESSFADVAATVPCAKDPFIPRIALQVTHDLRDLGEARRIQAGVNQYDHGALLRTAMAHDERERQRIERDERRERRRERKKRDAELRESEGVAASLRRFGTSVRRVAVNIGGELPREKDSSSTSSSSEDDVDTRPSSTDRPASTGGDDTTSSGDESPRGGRSRRVTFEARPPRRRVGSTGTSDSDPSASPSPDSDDDPRRRRSRRTPTRDRGRSDGGAGGAGGRPPRPRRSNMAAEKARRATVTGLFTHPRFDTPEYAIKLYRYCHALDVLCDDVHGENGCVAGDLVTSEINTFLLPMTTDIDLYFDSEHVPNTLAMPHLRSALRLLQRAATMI